MYIVVVHSHTSSLCHPLLYFFLFSFFYWSSIISVFMTFICFEFSHIGEHICLSLLFTYVFFPPFSPLTLFFTPSNFISYISRILYIRQNMIFFFLEFGFFCLLYGLKFHLFSCKWMVQFYSLWLLIYTTFSFVCLCNCVSVFVVFVCVLCVYLHT